MRRGVLASLLATAFLLGGAGTVQADGRWSLRQGVRFAQDAEFESALAAFESAERSRDLRREDLRRLYGHRAVVRFALGDRDAMEADLARLLAVDPQAELPSSAPPPVHEAFQRMRDLGVSSPRLAAQVIPRSSGVRIAARVEGGPPGLVRHVRVYARVPGARQWTRGEPRVSILARSGVTVQWYAQAVGPGGAVLGGTGSREDPRTHRVGESAAAPETASASLASASAEVGEDEDEARARRRKWWLVGTGATAAVGAAVVATVLLLAGGSGGDATRVSGPTLVR